MGTYRKNSALVERHLRDTCLLVPVMSTFAELDSLYSLNSTAQFIWSKACEGMDAQSIARELTDTYDIPVERALADTQAVLAQLCTMQLLTPNP